RIGVAGYTDLELADHLYPSLTTVHVDRHQLGFLAARTLADLLNRNITGPVQVYLQPSLVVRESTSGKRSNHPQIGNVGGVTS
ncbi:MAG: substrate-binding domain-containing protein, partial [Bacillota bacterium]